MSLGYIDSTKQSTKQTVQSIDIDSTKQTVQKNDITQGNSLSLGISLKQIAFSALLCFFFVSTVTFAALFGWSYSKQRL